MNLVELVESNDSIISYIEDKIDDLVRLADNVKDDYMAAWIGERTIRMSQKKADQTYREAEVGGMMPRVRVKSGKPIIEWTDQNSPKVKRINAKFSAVVNPHKTRGYTKEILINHSDEWERSIVLEFEEKFKLIRKSLNALHKTRIELAYVKRAVGKHSEAT